VYVFAGLAKLNSDWLLEALPMRIGYPATHLPIGGGGCMPWIASLFAWFGAAMTPFILDAFY
jgi:hypothetical protein